MDHGFHRDSNQKTSLKSISLPNLKQQSNQESSDPFIMKELEHYRKIMYLTLLPSISSSSPTENNNNTNLNEMQRDLKDKLVEAPEGGTLITMTPQGKPTSILNVNRKFSLQERKSSFPDLGGPPGTGAGSVIQKEKTRRVSEMGNRRISMRNKNIIEEEVTPIPATNSSGMEFSNDLDFSTLTALYLESRKKIFGDEWANRKNRKSDLLK